MNQDRDIALIDEMRAQPAETSWLEFKGNNADPEMIGKRCSALSNAARVEGRDCAYMLWGVDDDSHDVIGANFDPNATRCVVRCCRSGSRITCSQALPSAFGL
ncbi:MAG TPA: hypothetical protein VGN07_12540 [Steroidobacteraceae bacterium]|jgi:predicted HTH transcriptional regulator